MCLDLIVHHNFLEMREETTRRQQRAASMVRAQQLTQESHFSNLDYFITSETGSSPTTSPWRKSKETLISMEHGTYIAVEPGLAGPGEKVAGGDPEEEDEECMDWWTKYHASLDTMIEVRQSIITVLQQTASDTITARCITPTINSSYLTIHYFSHLYNHYLYSI